MATAKKYLHDKLVLLLLSGIIILAFVGAVFIFLRLGQGGEGYIAEYRSNLGISAFRTGNITSILSFVVFGIVVTVMDILLSIRTYQISRVLSLTILGSGILLLLLATIVSNALLVLR